MEYDEILVGKTYCIGKKDASGTTTGKVFVKAKIPCNTNILKV